MRWGAVKDHLRTVLAENRIPDDEPVVLKFPRQLAKRKIVNREKKCRVCWVTTPENFASFHAARSHVIEVLENPVLADKLIADVISRVPDETWLKFLEMGDDEA